ncbi:MAG: class IV adenylate cyclase [Desulfovibrio sp.]|jgi:adenylate cyclase class 2|uniref:class IV adenylate cyclase n=1 Tax=Desulfovibrio sp. TaxID=885 RepID=UPI00135D2FFA|nr:class IV adenylate cyclase [Desulfovibrio sp.]MTJ92387.1 class IV adenylate cyclase [Desulfovibrio sp.]
MGLEIERKYLHINLQSLRQKLVDNGAHCLGAHFESNWVYDSAEGGLVGGGQLLRLRTQQWHDKTRHLLTLKLPAIHDGGFKVREERETEVADGAVMRGILEGLGYRVAARYEKIREPWRMDLVEIELDILPFDQVVELEGRAEDIESVERRLNLDNAEISTKSYHELHQEWLRQNHKPAQLSFVFDEAQSVHWRTSLGLTERAAANPASTRQS